MKILNVESATNFSGGVNQTILNSLELSRRGHSVFVACVKNSPIHKKLQGRNIDFVFIEEGKIFSSSLIIRDFLNRSDVDIVHTHHSKGHTIGLMAVLFRKKEKLVVQRGVIFPAKNPLKYLNPRVNVFIANSEVVKEVLMRSFVHRKKIKVVYSAIDESRVEGLTREEVRNRFGLNGKFVFGVVANYSNWKGQDMLLEAFSKIGNKGNALLVFVGKDTEFLIDKAKKLGIEKYVRVLGFREDAPKLIKGFDCVVIPSKKGESLPNVAVEAFFSKTVVAGTSIGGLPELLKDGRGFLCEPNAKSLMGMILAVYNYDKRNEMMKRAYKFAKENLTIQKKVDRLEEIYKELLSC